MGKRTKYLALVLAPAVALIGGCRNGEVAVEPPPVERRPAKNYSITVVPTVLEGNKVSAEISTNIPGRIELEVTLLQTGSKPDEQPVGAKKTVAVTGGKGQTVLGEGDLPDGDYVLEVTLYPRWGLKDQLAGATGIGEKIATQVNVTLGGPDQ